MPNTSPQKQIAPYGSWASNISADLLTAGNVRLSEARLFDGKAYWLESRPAEKGRSVLVEYDLDSEKPAPRDLIPAPLGARTKAHEYGGGVYTVGNGYVYFVLAADQRIYRIAPGSDIPEPVTPAGPWHFADLQLDQRRNRLICVQEEESESGCEAVARLIAIALDRKQGEEFGRITVLAEGADFYSNPALSPDGLQLSFLQWHHPDMPWDATKLMLAELDETGAVAKARHIAGGNGESIFQPQWSPSGQLYYISDKSNWWNIYLAGSDQPLWDLDAEFATPQWVFGMSTYGFLDDARIFCTFTRSGRWQLALLDLNTGQPRLLEHSGCDFESIHCTGDRALFISSGTADFPSVVMYQADSNRFTTIASSSAAPVETSWFSRAQTIDFEHEHRLVHAFYYPPCNPTYTAPAGEKPPLIVFGHGGPTGATSAGLNLKVQYWTSRGFAILDVNYSGSTGYGRKYRDRLQGQWGILDVEDVCAGAEYLVQQGLADPARLLIKGGSAGGYTVLAALTFHDTFSAGASHYGIGDLTTLARDTHKFESRYLDKLVGPWPEAESVYRARSPINHIEQLDCPVIFFQGMEDKVVPPDQAETMVVALRNRGIPVAYITFEDEGHGFRGADSIKLALEGELEFYSRIFGFPLPTPGPGIKIDNLREVC
ncbi:prolyl oligopeptidase family serine peptidase [Microbulbifer sp. SH-1]|uniref:S9 family peptidase n=1 Tax=Microbulbifer sp. SH-1 TaxID=2681547 RepID=UPI001408E3F1|nr:S9 family peptidase [Microbulbifer sp. SH-1]QIL89017.1 prolyl oligopeptidase family serine peptidase [Microbulbifer sp. SH-1]